jgi:iron complex outermembrane recepter protein
MKKILLLAFHALLSLGIAYGQEKFTGTVKDDGGEPIVGANIIIKGTKVYTVSDINGQFTLTSPKAFPFTVQFTSVGFKTQEVEIFELTDEAFEINLAQTNVLNEIVVTSRRRSETLQEVPIPVSVVGGDVIEESGAFNVNRVKELVPTVQLYSSNPRNTTLNVRGLGSTFGLTNDGIDPGVGFYVDGVYYARPAATTLDFIDIEQIEVLRGPQGTLFGKNTTAGAFNVTTKRPSFVPGASFEVSYGNYGYIQAKSSVTGPLGKKFAARVSFSGTQRRGTIYNVYSDKYINDLNNIGGRFQLLYTPNDKINIILAGDASRQRPEGYSQVVAGVVQTKRAAFRQFNAIIADLNWQLPTTNGFDRKVDQNTTWRSGNDLGGASLNVEAKIGSGTLTSTSAWRYWGWDPSNDRDFTALSSLRLSQATSKHQQWSQEIRYAGDISSKVSGVIGVFAIAQDLKADPYHVEESGKDQWRFSINAERDTALWKTPGLLDGYGIRTRSKLQTLSAAVFAQVDWKITEKIHFLPGIRYNYDKKEVNFDRQTYGGLQTSDPKLIAIKKRVYSDQFFTADADDTNFSGQATLSYKPTSRLNLFATYSTSYKPVGVNLGGLPTRNDTVLVDLATVKPELVNHAEIGIKTSPTKRSTLNLTFYQTDVRDYQTLVQTAEIGVNRGYLANAERVRVQGVELEGNIRVSTILSVNGALAYTDGQYVKFTNAPVPLEETGKTIPDPNDDSKTVEVSFKDISGGQLPGISKWAGSFGSELTSNQVKILEQNTKLFIAFDVYYRSEFSSSPSPSQFLNVEGYALLNARLGFRATNGLSLSIWSRNLLDQDYYEQLLPAAGNAGHYAGVLGDPRTTGITLRYIY